jgi:hypothetical protein
LNQPSEFCGNSAAHQNKPDSGDFLFEIASKRGKGGNHSTPPRFSRYTSQSLGTNIVAAPQLPRTHVPPRSPIPTCHGSRETNKIHPRRRGTSPLEPSPADSPADSPAASPQATTRTHPVASLAAAAAWPSKRPSVPASRRPSPHLLGSRPSWCVRTAVGIAVEIPLGLNDHNFYILYVYASRRIGTAFIANYGNSRFFSRNPQIIMQIHFF